MSCIKRNKLNYVPPNHWQNVARILRIFGKRIKHNCTKCRPLQLNVESLVVAASYARNTTELLRNPSSNYIIQPVSIMQEKNIFIK